MLQEPQKQDWNLVLRSVWVNNHPLALKALVTGAGWLSWCDGRLRESCLGELRAADKVDGFSVLNAWWSRVPQRSLSLCRNCRSRVTWSQCSLEVSHQLLRPLCPQPLCFQSLLCIFHFGFLLPSQYDHRHNTLLHHLNLASGLLVRLDLGDILCLVPVNVCGDGLHVHIDGLNRCCLASLADEHGVDMRLRWASLWLRLRKSDRVLHWSWRVHCRCCIVPIPKATLWLLSDWCMLHNPLQWSVVLF